MGGGRGNQQNGKCKASAAAAPPRSTIPFDWHGDNGEMFEPPRQVVDYLDAVHRGDAEKLQSAIERGAHVDTSHRCGMTGLIIAADLGNCDIVKLLLGAGADVHALWSNKPALFYAARNKEGAADAEGEEGAEQLERRRKTFEILQEWSAKTPIAAEDPTALPPLEDPPVPPAGPLKYKTTATEDNVKELLAVVANAAQSDLNREDAASALRAMTAPAETQRKRNAAMLLKAGAADSLIGLLRAGPTHGCKEQACAALRGLLRSAGPAHRAALHAIRKAMREEAGKWAGLGTPESEARISELERRVAERGGVCVVRDREELERLQEAGYVYV